MTSWFRDPLAVVFVDPDNHELAQLRSPQMLPRVGENVRLAGVPYVVERIGYDIPDDTVTRVWVVLRSV